MKNNKKLTQSLERYLLAIYETVKQNSAARVKDISQALNIGGPATSDAIKTLAQKGYINYVPYGIITLTQKGKRKALAKIRRHEVIANFLENVLLIDKNLVDKNAKAIEYSMTEEVLEKFVQFLSFMDKCSCKKPKWKNSYEYYSKNNEMQKKCQQCTINTEGYGNCCCRCH